MLKYYYDLMSQPSRAIYLFLHRTKIPFEKCKVDLSRGAHLTDEYTAIHPFKQVPAIDDSGFKLIESVAIFRYLCRAYPDNVANHWYPRDVKKQVLVDSYMEWQHANTRFSCALYFRHKWLLPILTGNPPKQSSVDHYQKGMEKAINDIETVWLKDRTFLAGDKISIADILAVCELQQPSMCGYDVFYHHDRLSHWFEAVKSEIGTELEMANVILNKVVAKHLAQKPKL